jgi:hypothetical protein
MWMFGSDRPNISVVAVQNYTTEEPLYVRHSIWYIAGYHFSCLLPVSPLRFRIPSSQKDHRLSITKTMPFKSSTIFALLFASTALAAQQETRCTKNTEGENCIRCLDAAGRLCYTGKCKTRIALTGKRVSYDTLEASAGDIKADLLFSLLL